MNPITSELEGTHTMTPTDFIPAARAIREACPTLTQSETGIAKRLFCFVRRLEVAGTLDSGLSGQQPTFADSEQIKIRDAIDWQRICRQRERHARHAK